MNKYINDNADEIIKTRAIGIENAKRWRNKKMNKTPHEMIMKMKEPDKIFDLICTSNYFCGNFNAPIPIEESREAFKRIKKLLLKKGQ